MEVDIFIITEVPSWPGVVAAAELFMTGNEAVDCMQMTHFELLEGVWPWQVLGRAIPAHLAEINRGFSWKWWAVNTLLLVVFLHPAGPAAGRRVAQAFQTLLHSMSRSSFNGFLLLLLRYLLFSGSISSHSW